MSIIKSYENGYNSQIFIATAGQTLFKITNNGAFQRGKNLVDVRVNDVIETNFTEESSRSIKLARACNAGDKVELVWYEGLMHPYNQLPEEYEEALLKIKNSAVYQQIFITTEGQTVIDLNRDFLVGQNRVSLSIGGVRQYAGQDYTETDTHTLTMASPLKGGLKAEVVMFTASQAIAEDFFEKTVAAIEATQAANEAATSTRLNWKVPVNTFSNIATTYPAPQLGDVVFVRDTGKVFRYNGTSWVEIQDIDPTPINEVDSRLGGLIAENSQQLTDTIVTARKIGLIASDSSKAAQNATTLNQYLNTNQNTTITFLNKEYFFNNTITMTATNKLKGQKGTKLSLTVTDKDFIYLKPFSEVEAVLLNLPANHTKAGVALYDGNYTQWVTNHFHQIKDVFIYGNPTLTSTGISLDAANGYNVSNFTCNNVTILNCNKGVSITASGDGWASSNSFDNIYPQNCTTGYYLYASGTGQVGGNRFIHQFQFSTNINGQTAIYCNGFENSFIGKVWDAKPSQIIVHFDNGSKNNYIGGTGFPPNVKNVYVIDHGQDNFFAGALDNVPQIRGAYKYDVNNSWQPYNWQKFYGSYSDTLYNADKIHTVNLSLGSSSILSGSMNTLFGTNTGISFANATDASPIVLEIVFSTTQNNVTEYGITFQYGFTPRSVKIEYATTSGGTYTTAVNTTTNRLPHVAFAPSPYGSNIGKIRITLANAIVNATTNATGRIGIGNVYMYSTNQMGTYYLPSNGGNMYGTLNMNGNYIQVGGKASLPAASATYRGMMAYVSGNGTTSADILYICLMSSTGTYSWKQLITG